MLQEGKEMGADFGIAFSQPLAMATGRGQAHDGVEVAVQAASVLGAGALGQVPSSSGDDEGPQQERLHTWGEDGIAGFDGAYLQSRSWWARQTCQASAWPCCPP